MITRLSNYFFKTLREAPNDVDVLGHALLLRAGYIRRQAPGIFVWLPFGLKVRSKIEAIIREEMTNAGAFEVKFPALLQADPYKETGRWLEYGDAMFRLQDRKKTDYVLAPTHEEVFTQLVKDLYSSYKDLPVTIYQIQDKYRDEIRPRAGLLRGREFSMKDAYSFDIDDEGLENSYLKQREAYKRIFTRLGLEFVIVAADAGAMGGSRSEEFLHPTPIGEDTFVKSEGGYAANVEAYRVPESKALAVNNDLIPKVIETPGVKAIKDLITFLNSKKNQKNIINEAEALKIVLIKIRKIDNNTEIIALALPGDRDIDAKRLEVLFSPSEVLMASEQDLKDYPDIITGFVGPWHKDKGLILGEESLTNIKLYADSRIIPGSVWLTGANEEGKHIENVIVGREFIPDKYVEISDVRDGDLAPDGSGPIKTYKGMEIGHIFQLGRKYAEALDLKVLDQNGKLATVTMGSYGIGVTRIMAILAEINNDDKGLIWPETIAPFNIHVVAAGKDEEIFNIAEKISQNLSEEGFEVIYDDRKKLSPGVKFTDAELIGVPYIIVVGRDATEGYVEFWSRASSTKEKIAIENITELIKSK